MARLDSSTFPELSEGTVAKLHARNIFTVYDFMLQTCDDLMKKTGLSFKEIESIRESFHERFGAETTNPLDQYKIELRHKIPTGIKNLDGLLQGGLHCRQIYEICGSFSAGKSQLCHWISLYTTLNASAEVHYIDASRNFCISRIQMILESMQCSDRDIGKVMSSIKVYNIHTMSQIFTILYHLSSNKDKTESSKKIVIVDSLSVLCAIIPTNDLNSILSSFASVCRFLVNHLNAVVVIVNTIRFEQGGATLADIEKNTGVNLVKPSLGTYWIGIPNVRLLISQLEKNRREISVWKSCQLENGKKCFVDIKDEGIF